MAKINWTLRNFNLADLTDYYKNPRSLSEKEFKQLKTSLDKFGMIDKPIVNLDSANTIIGGHQRKHVLEASGVKECECWIPDRELSEKEVEELNIRLNKNTGSWDFDTLANEFQLDDLLDWGFDKGELDIDLWADEAPEDVEPQIDKAEELRVKWGVESGQLWQLGEHRLICGDCTDKAVVERVMGEEKADTLVSDPPYGIGYEYDVHSDASNEQNKQLVMDSWKLAPDAKVWTPGLMNLERDLFWNPGAKVLCWHKGFAQAGSGLGGASTWEPVLVTNIKGGTLPDDYLHFGTDRVKGLRELHSCPKPIALFEHLIEHLAGAIVYEPFLGSGTTLIACERLGRKCRAVEISPAYVAVAIQRWVDVTGGEPVLLDT